MATALLSVSRFAFRVAFFRSAMLLPLFRIYAFAFYSTFIIQHSTLVFPASTLTRVHAFTHSRFHRFSLPDDAARCILVHTWGCKLRTNIVLDEVLVEEAFKLGNARTKKELINEALKEYVENRRRLSLLDLAGKINFADGYDYKAMREGK